MDAILAGDANELGLGRRLHGHGTSTLLEHGLRVENRCPISFNKHK